MSNSVQNQSVNVGFPIASILTIIFVLAKLAGHFAYSWWIVFLPLIVSAGIFVAFIALALLIGLLG